MFAFSRRKQLVKIYKSINEDDNRKARYEWGSNTEQLMEDYPKLELTEVVLIAGYMERGKDVQEFEEALKKLGVR